VVSLPFRRVFLPKFYLELFRSVILLENINPMRQRVEMDRSVRSNGGSLCLNSDDRRYLEALKDSDYVVTKNTRHPLGLFSVVAFIVQQVIGRNSRSTAG